MSEAKRMIPVAAVAAAAESFYGSTDPLACRRIEAALEAAAPHMACAEPTAADRDRLAEVIWGVEAEDVGTFKTGVTSKAAARIADAILAAGYRKATR